MNQKKKLYSDLPFKFDYDKYSEHRLEIMVKIFIHAPFTHDITERNLIILLNRYMSTPIDDFLQLSYAVKDYCEISNSTFTLQNGTYNISL